MYLWCVRFLLLRFIVTFEILLQLFHASWFYHFCNTFADYGLDVRFHKLFTICGKLSTDVYREMESESISRAANQCKCQNIEWMHSMLNVFAIAYWFSSCTSFHLKFFYILFRFGDLFRAWFAEFSACQRNQKEKSFRIPLRCGAKQRFLVLLHQFRIGQFVCISFP